MGSKDGNAEKSKKPNFKVKSKAKRSNVHNAKTKVEIGGDGLSNWKQFLKARSKEKEATNGIVHHRKRKPQSHKSDENIKKGSKEDIWFDDVDPLDIEATKFISKEAVCDDSNKRNNLSENVVTPKDGNKDDEEISNDTVKRDTKAVALDCEMVGVGFQGQTSVLARVSIVNAFGDVLYDEYVKPKEKVIDYRTHVSGIRPENLENGLSFEQVQREVSDILDKKILVGHALSHDFKVLMLSHPKKMIRDTANYNPYRKIAKTAFPSLKKLSQMVLQKQIQSGEHSSVEDARTTMELYRHCKKDWESLLKNKHSKYKMQKNNAMLTAKEKHQLFCARRQKNKFKRK